MWTNSSIKRLADKSAFVVFDRLSYKTYVVQTQFIFDYFAQNDNACTKQEFENLNEVSQIEILVASGIEKEVH